MAVWEDAVSISPQLGHLPAAGGGRWCPKRWEEPTPKWTGRMWGHWERRRSGGQTGSVPEAGEIRRGRREGPSGNSGREVAGDLLAHSGQGACWAPRLVNSSKAPSRMCGSWGHKREAGRSGEAGGRGPLGGAGEKRKAFALPTQAQEACWAPWWGPPPSETRGVGHAWAHSVPWA